MVSLGRADQQEQLQAQPFPSQPPQKPRRARTRGDTAGTEGQEGSEGGCRRSPAPLAHCWCLSKALPVGASAFLNTKLDSSQQRWEQPVPGTALSRGKARGEEGSGTASLLGVFSPQNLSLFEAYRGDAATPGWAEPSGAPAPAGDLLEVALPSPRALLLLAPIK